MENDEENLEQDINLENVGQDTEELVDGNETVENTKKETDTEENTPKKEYTDEEIEQIVNQKIDSIIPDKKKSLRRNIEKEYKKKYGKMEKILQSALGAENVDDITAKLQDIYKNQDINIPNETSILNELSDDEIGVLAEHEANQIIKSGKSEISEELERLYSKGFDKLDKKEKIVFQKLVGSQKIEKDKKELQSIGVKTEILNDEKFIKFKNKFNQDTPIKEIYAIYEQQQPKKQVTPIGSMTSNVPEKEKTYYTPEEANKLTKKDMENPVIFKNLRESMKKW